MVNDLVKAEGVTASSEPSGNTGSDLKTFQDISVAIEYGNVYKITLNRPAKYNAITVKVSINN